MTIKYQNSSRKFVSVQQAQLLDDYYKVFINGDVIVKTETYYNKSLVIVEYYNNNQQEHVTIIELLNQIYSNCSLFIVERQDVNLGYELQESYHYSPEAILIASSTELFDPEMNLVAVRYKDNMGNMLNDGITKWYYDASRDPDTHIFKCFFDDLTGEFDFLEFFDESTMYHLEDTIYLENNPEDLQKLIDLTGMSLALAQYYFTNEIEPNF